MKRYFLIASVICFLSQILVPMVDEADWCSVDSHKGYCLAGEFLCGALSNVMISADSSYFIAMMNGRKISYEIVIASAKSGCILKRYSNIPLFSPLCCSLGSLFSFHNTEQSLLIGSFLNHESITLDTCQGTPRLFSSQEKYLLTEKKGPWSTNPIHLSLWDIRTRNIRDDLDVTHFFPLSHGMFFISQVDQNDSLSVKIISINSGKFIEHFILNEQDFSLYNKHTSITHDGCFVAHCTLNLECIFVRNALSGDIDGKIVIWDVQTGNLKKIFKETSSIYCMIFTQDGKNIILGLGDNRIRIRNIESEKIIQDLHGHAFPPMSLGVSADGKTMISGSIDNTLKIWSLETMKLLHSCAKHTSTISCIAITFDEKKVASGSWDGSVKIWDRENGALLDTYQDKSKREIRSILLTKDQKRMIIGDWSSHMTIISFKNPV